MDRDGENQLSYEKQTNWWIEFALHVAVHLNGVLAVKTLLNSSEAEPAVDARRKTLVWRSLRLTDHFQPSTCPPQSCDDLVFLEVLSDFFENGEVAIRLGALTRSGWCMSPDSSSTTGVLEKDIRDHFNPLGYDLDSTPPDVIAGLWVSALQEALSAKPSIASQSQLSICSAVVDQSVAVSIDIPFSYSEVNQIAVWRLQSRIPLTEVAEPREIIASEFRSQNKNAIASTTSTAALCRVPSMAMSMWLRSLHHQPPHIESLKEAAPKESPNSLAQDLLNLVLSKRRLSAFKARSPSVSPDLKALPSAKTDVSVPVVPPERAAAPSRAHQPPPPPKQAIAPPPPSIQIPTVPEVKAGKAERQALFERRARKRKKGKITYESDDSAD
jgi:hypothetical protein